MGVIMALITAILWGSTPLWTHFLGGKPIQQLLGTTYGALGIGILMFLIKRPVITGSGFWWCFLSGMCWSVGQLTQYEGFDDLSVSTTTPIVAGVQLVGVNLVGVMFFGSWASSLAKVVGFSAVILIGIGVYLTTRTGKKHEPVADKVKMAKDIVKLLLGTGIGYTACSTLPKIPETNGWSTYPPSSVGMIVGAVLLTLVIKKYRDQHELFTKGTLKNMFTGINSGLGSFTYLVTIMLAGVSTGFTLSQMSTVVSVLDGLLILHERKNHKALMYTFSGLLLVIVGGVITGFIQ